MTQRFLLGLTALLCLTAAADAQTKLLRFPDIHGDQVIFTYAGDLWLAATDGGAARRLTSHPGLELFAKFSPGGSHVAFTGQYDGDEQVYVVPVTGGAPRQLTFYPARGPLPPRWGYDHQVFGWTPDGQSVVFRSHRDGWDLGEAHLFTVPAQGGVPERLPMPQSGAGAFSPDGARLVYSPLFRDFRHWKRYEGGWAQDLYLFEPATAEARRLTDHPRTERDPMWIGDRVYFAADWTGTLQLYGLEVGEAAAEAEQLTDHDTWDVRWPSADGAGDRIVYELAGELRILDLASGENRPVSIEVPSDLLSTRPTFRHVGDLVSGVSVAPGGQRVAFTARGDLFTVPAENGPVRNLTRSSGAFDRSPAWSPDGGTIAFVSDQDGEEEIWRVAQDGHGRPEQLTDGHTTRFGGLEWSPDGERIAFQDADARLWVLEVASRELTQVADDAAKFGLSYGWSPRGGHLVFTLQDPNDMGSIHIWSRRDGEVRRVTSERTNDSRPRFGPKGDYLYFLSDREYHPQIGAIEFNYAHDRETYLYALALRADVEHPFPPRSDEVEVEEGSSFDDEGESDEDGDEDADSPEADDDSGEESGRGGKDAKKKSGAKDAKDSKPIVIDFEGLGERIARVPVDADNYGGLSPIDGQLLYVRGTPFYYGRGPGEQPEVVLYDLEKRKESTLLSGFRGFALSPDGSHLVAATGGGWQLFKVKKGAKGKALDLGRLATEVDPVAEWRQIFDDAWRRFRDYFYVENMHGYDWEAIRERYRPLLEHVAHRSDLNYLVSEMIAELNVSHAYVTGGDIQRPERPTVPLLGVRLEGDSESGRYRVAEIFAGDNSEPPYRSPLTEIGVGVAVGDYLLEIDGRPLTAGDNPYAALRHADPRHLELTVSKTPELEGSRRVMVDPIRSEDDLLYLAWVERNRRRVSEATDGRVGYLHIPDMGGDGIREWIKHFYPQLRKEGLVIDVRSNGGGNISPMLLERLERQLYMVDYERHRDRPDSVPGRVFLGHMVCLINETTASDGDQFAWGFRQKGLGPLIGKRSWGGVVGIYGGSELIDGGAVSVPEAGSADAEGQWVIEGYGVDPDIEIENDPASLVAGRDRQLERAIEEVWSRVQAEPRRLPERPAPPVKTP